MPITPHLVTKWRVLLKTNCLSKVEYLSDCYGNIPEYLRTGQYLNNDNCRKNFGPKGYGFGGGAGTLSMDDGKGYKTNPNEVGALLQSFWIIENQWGSVRIGEDRGGSLWIIETTPNDNCRWTTKQRPTLLPKNHLCQTTHLPTWLVCWPVFHVHMILSNFSRVKGSRIWGPKAEAKVGRCWHLPKVSLATILQPFCNRGVC